MNREEQIKKIADFIKSVQLCTVSTVNAQNKPQSAVMAFSQTEKLELIIATRNDTRKYRNLQSNHNVSIVIGWDLDMFITIQYEGIAREVKVETEIARCKEIHLAKNPQSREFAEHPENRYFIVEPKWVRYWDIKGNEKFEVEF